MPAGRLQPVAVKSRQGLACGSRFAALPWVPLSAHNLVEMDRKDPDHDPGFSLFGARMLSPPRSREHAVKKA
jgi:hypothetical protein